MRQTYPRSQTTHADVHAGSLTSALFFFILPSVQRWAHESPMAMPPLPVQWTRRSSLLLGVRTILVHGGLLLAPRRAHLPRRRMQSSQRSSTASLELPFLLRVVSQTCLFWILRWLHWTLQLPPSTPVVLLGCSYSGTVAAYAHTSPGVVGVVASSAPVQPEVAMESYHASIASAFSDPSAGGSAACGGLITAAFSNASTMMARGDWHALASAWGSCEPVTELEDAQFMWCVTRRMGSCRTGA